MRTRFITAIVLTLGFTVAQRGLSQDPQIVNPDHLFIVDARGKVIAPLEADSFHQQVLLLKEGHKLFRAVATPDGFRFSGGLGYLTDDCSGPPYLAVDDRPGFYDAIPTYIHPINGDYYHPVPGAIPFSGTILSFPSVDLYRTAVVCEKNFFDGVYVQAERVGNLDDIYPPPFTVKKVGPQTTGAGQHQPTEGGPR